MGNPPFIFPKTGCLNKVLVVSGNQATANFEHWSSGGRTKLSVTNPFPGWDHGDSGSFHTGVSMGTVNQLVQPKKILREARSMVHKE